MLHAPPVLGSRGDNIDPRGVDAAVTQNIRQLRDILLDAVKRAGEQMP